jgi:hypothetical protein
VLLQLECAANATFMKEVCEVWHIPSYCGLTGDNNLLQFNAEVPLRRTVRTDSKVCVFSVLIMRGHQAWVRDSLELMESRRKMKGHLCYPFLQWGPVSECGL